MTGPDPDDPSTLDRNLEELLQELRVIQTGVQILTGFLLTVPFSARFEDLDQLQRMWFLVVISGSVLTTGLVVAPVAFHRTLFRRRRRRWLVESAHTSARAGLVMLALTSSGVLFLVFDIVVGTVAGAVAFVLALAFFAIAWLAIPTVEGRRDAHLDVPTDSRT